MEIKRILVGSPVRQKHQILEQFLLGLEEVDQTGFELTYYFVDDNVDEQSSALLEQFARKHDVVLKKGSELTDLDIFSKYVSDEITHLWDPTTIRKVAYFKDSIIEYAVEHHFDYLFFVDSDIVVDKRTLHQLASRNVDIISNVFWTQWQPNWELEPQCFWMPALNVQSVKPFAPPISGGEARQLQRNFFAKMRIPGMYKVDGLGACTLLSYNCLAKGVRFKEIPNLALLGEDRHFCVRAGALGYTLYFDTVYPVYHIYREEYLNRVEEFKREGFKYDMCQTYIPEPPNPQSRIQRIGKELREIVGYVNQKTFARLRARKKPYLWFTKAHTGNRVVLMMAVREESKAYLAEALRSVADAVDFALLADATADVSAGTIAASILGDRCKVVTVQGQENGYAKLWPMAAEYDARWVLAMNADEVLHTGGAEAIRYLVDNVLFDAYSFRQYDMRTADEYHGGNTDKQLYLMRYRKDYPFTWGAADKLPAESTKLIHADMNLKVRCYEHMGENEPAMLKSFRDLADEI